MPKKHFCINMNGASGHSANSSTVSLACLWQPVPNKSPLFVLVWAFLLCQLLQLCQHCKFTHVSTSLLKQVCSPWPTDPCMCDSTVVAGILEPSRGKAHTSKTWPGAGRNTRPGFLPEKLVSPVEGWGGVLVLSKTCSCTDYITCPQSFCFLFFI